MTKWMLTIPHVNGEDKKDRMLRIHNLIRDSVAAEGFEGSPYRPARPANQISAQLEATAQDQRVAIQIIEPGTRINLARARRRFTPEFEETVNEYAFNTGDDELDRVFQRIMPEYSKQDLEMLADSSSARKKAFDSTVDGMVGLDSKIRTRGLSRSDKFLKSYIIGHAPARGGRALSESRQRELQDLVKASLGDLGLQGEDSTELLRHRIQSRPLLMNSKVEMEFRHMIHAYHEVRMHNASYLQAMMGGMQGAKDPEGLISALLPSPDDIMRGSIAHLIIDLNTVPAAKKLSTLSELMRELYNKLLNYEKLPGYVKGTDKQKSVARLIASFNDRKTMVASIENAVKKAQLRGADFVTGFQVGQPADITEEAIKDLVKSPEDIDITEEDTAKGLTADLLTGGDAIFVRDMMLAMEKEGLAFMLDGGRTGQVEDPVSKKLIRKKLAQGFVILPIELPRFSKRPVGWDRRWMVATMRVIDEYWDFIYSKDGILISNLLYLIVSRAEELFNYTMDLTEITQLTILLTKESNERAAGARRRGILPVPVKEDKPGYLPLKSLTQLVTGSDLEASYLQEIEDLKEEVEQAQEELQKLEDDHDVLMDSRIDEKNKVIDKLKEEIASLTKQQEEEEEEEEDDQLSPEDARNEVDDNIFDYVRELLRNETRTELLPDLKDLEINGEVSKALLYWATAFLPDDALDRLQEAAPTFTTAARRSRRASVGSETKVGFVGLVHSEVSVPKTRALTANMNKAMDTMIATLTANGKAMGAKSIRNIRVESFSIGDSLIGLIGIGDAYKTLNNPRKNVPLYYDATGGYHAETTSRLSEILLVGNYDDLRKLLLEYFNKFGPIDDILVSALAAAYRRQEIANDRGVGVEKAFADAQKVEDAISLASTSNIGRFHGRGKRKPLLNTSFGEIIEAAVEEVKKPDFKNNPDTCCMICGSCDDPCDCKDNPWQGLPPTIEGNDKSFYHGTTLSNAKKIFDSRWFHMKEDWPTFTDSLDVAIRFGAIARSEGGNRDDPIVILELDSEAGAKSLKRLDPVPDYWNLESKYYYSVEEPIPAYFLRALPYTEEQYNAAYDEMRTKNRNSHRWPNTTKPVPTTEQYRTLGLRKDRDGHAERWLSDPYHNWWNFREQKKHAAFYEQKKNPPASNHTNRKYKGHIISKVSTGWMVDAYGQSFKTLKQARDYISKKVSGSASANEQCVRILKGSRCSGTVVLVKSKKYRCAGCNAEYRVA
jgi:hypothetical protein